MTRIILNKQSVNYRTRVVGGDRDSNRLLTNKLQRPRRDGYYNIGDRFHLPDDLDVVLFGSCHASTISVNVP